MDYAISILEQVVLREPGFLEARQALRAAQIKKHGSGGGFFKKMIGSASNSPLLAKGHLALRKNPIEAMAVAEQMLSSEPNSQSANKLLAEAALAAELPKTACFALELAKKQAPKDTEIRRCYARALSAAGLENKSEEVYQELVAENPDDPELLMEYKNLAAKKTLVQQGYEALADGSGSYRDVLKNKEEAVSIEQENRQVKTEDVAAKLIIESLARLQREPDNMKVVRGLAELYTQKNEFEKALECYQRMKNSPSGNDPSLDKAIAETRTRRLNHELSLLDATDPDYETKKGELERQRTEFILAECKDRTDRYPTDLQIKFELGELYFKAGKVTEAIQEFQKAQTNPNRRLQCVSYLGQCFSRRGMHDMAVRKFQDALKEKPEFDDVKKELIYHLGCALDALGKKGEAIEQFKQIYESDIGYKDVATRVETYYASGGS